MFGPEKPTVREVAEYRKKYEDIWRNAHVKFEVAESFYNRTHAVWSTAELARARTNFWPSTGTSKVDQAVDQQFGYDPKVHCYPGGDGAEHKRKANLKERFLTAVLNDCALREKQPLWRQLNLYGTVYGAKVLEGPTLDLSGLPEEPEQREDEPAEVFKARQAVYDGGRQSYNPFRLQAPNPAWVLMDPWDLSTKCAIKVYKAERGELAEKAQMKRIQAEQGAAKEVYDLPVEAAGDTAFTKVKVTEVWTRYWHGVYLDESPVFVEANFGGFVPFDIEFSGSGVEPAVLADRDPDNLCVSLLEPVFAELTMHAQNVNSKNNAVNRGLNPILATAGDNAAGIANSMAQGGIVENVKKDEVFWLPSPELAAWIMQADQELLLSIERGTFSSMTAGFKDVRVQTATEYQGLSNATGRTFITANRQTEKLVTLAAELVLMLVERWGKAVTVQGITLRPEDVDGIYDCRVTFENVDPVVQAQLKAGAQVEVQMGTMSRQTYYESFGGEDWEKELDRIAEDALQQSPLLVLMRQVRVAKRLGEIELAALLENKAKQLRFQMEAEMQQMMAPPMSQPGMNGAMNGAGAVPAGAYGG